MISLKKIYKNGKDMKGPLSDEEISWMSIQSSNIYKIILKVGRI